MDKKIKIIFVGSPDFAIPALKKILDDGRFEVLAVVTVPDKPAGRGQDLTPPPIKRFAAEKGLTVWQPSKLREIKDELAESSPDLLVVIAYGKLIPKDILDIPKYGCVNVHGSILPRYRGAAVLQAPILNGDDKTGVSIMLMDEGLDTGPILKIGEMHLEGKETVGEIHDKLAKLGADILPQTLIDLVNGAIEPQPQNGPSTYVKEISKEDGRIDWSKPAFQLERMVRAFSPWPGTFTQIKDKGERTKNLKILETENEIIPTNEHSVGEVFLNDGKLAVQCGQGSLIVTKLQIEGAKPLPAEEFIRGHRYIIGAKL